MAACAGSGGGRDRGNRAVIACPRQRRPDGAGRGTDNRRKQPFVGALQGIPTAAPWLETDLKDDCAWLGHRHSIPRRSGWEDQQSAVRVLLGRRRAARGTVCTNTIRGFATLSNTPAAACASRLRRSAWA